MHEQTFRYWSFIDWEYPERGFVFGLNTASGRFACIVHELLDKDLNPIPKVIVYRGSDEVLLDFFHDYYEENKERYFDIIKQYYADVDEINSINDAAQ